MTRDLYRAEDTTLKISGDCLEVEGVSFGTLSTDTVSVAAEREQRRIERALRGAIRAGFDGVDIDYAPSHELARQSLAEVSLGPERIVPWNRPAPDGANGYRTERYTWDWFSDDELTAILTDDGLVRRLAAELREKTDE